MKVSELSRSVEPLAEGVGHQAAAAAQHSSAEPQGDEVL